MCLAVPMRIVSRSAEYAIAETGGVQRKILLTFVPDATVGDYVVVHAGYALEKLDEEDALHTLALLRELGAAEP